MIDWLTYSLPYDGPPIGSQYFRAQLDQGVIEPAYTRPQHLKGSFDSGLSVEAIGNRVRILGNPVKHFTGQNIIGTNNIAALVEYTTQYVFDCLQIEMPDITFVAMNEGETLLHRVDCTFPYHVGSTEDVRKWLRAMSDCAHVRYRGRGHYDDGMCSVMFGITVKPGEKAKGSTYSSFKFYCKETEVKKRPLKCDTKYHDKLMSYAIGHVRAEALYRLRELKQLSLEKVSQWTAQTALTLNQKWIEKMEIVPNVMKEPHAMIELPHHLRATYLHWINGQDVRNLMTRPTFYRQRKALLEHDIDIAGPSPVAKETLVVPLVEVLRARPACHDSEPLFWSMLRAA